MSKVLIRILVLVALIAWCDGTSRPFSRKKKKSKKHKAVTKEDSWSSLSSIDWMDMTSKEVRRYKRKKRKRKKASTTTSTTRGPSNDDNLVSLSVLYVGNVDVSVMKVYDTDTKRKRCKFHHIVSGDELVCDAGDDDDDAFSDSTTFKLKRTDGTSCIGYLDTTCTPGTTMQGCDDLEVSRSMCGNGVQNKVAIAHESNHVPRLITNNMDHTEGENPHEFTNDVDIEPMEIDAVDIDPVDLHEPYDEETTPPTPRPTPDVDDVMHSAVDRQHNSAMHSAVDRQQHWIDNMCIVLWIDNIIDNMHSDVEMMNQQYIKKEMMMRTKK
eukprot:1079367_1